MDRKLSNNENQKVDIQSPNVRRRLRVGDPDFVPPDGRWGWLIVFACGFSNLSTFPMYQQFGLVFRKRFEDLNISSAQMTSVTNMNFALNSCMGLTNGPLFRKFTYRQVAICGSLLVASSLFLCQYCDNFWKYMILYSVLYGSANGITQSSCALALNTYFKEKRRLATGLSWSITALGPIVWPYVIVALNNLYGMEGTLLLFSGFALHAFLCSLLLQPVEWHTKFRDMNPESPTILHNDESENKSNKRLFSNQHLQNEDDPVDTVKNCSGSQVKRNISQIKKPTTAEELEHHINNEELYSSNPPVQPRENEVVTKAVKNLTDDKEHNLDNKQNTNMVEKELESQKPKKITIWKKISIFFGFELFTDSVYVNLMLGLTVANFAEINFSILTPMVLEEFKFEEFEIATFMSLLGAIDVVVRFFIPLIADKIGWENKTFFLVGVLAMAFGRVILVHTQTYIWGLIVAVIIGAGKGLRTIFIALVIPSYVSLEKLPAASGLQLATSGLLFVVLGPVVGWIRDAVDNYVVTLHLLNICTYATAVAWITQDIFSKKAKAESSEVTKPKMSFKK